MAKTKDCKMQTIPVPILDDETIFDDWKTKIERWLILSDHVEVKKKAILISMYLKGKAERAAQEIDNKTLQSADGVKILLKELESVFHPDEGRKRVQIYRKLRGMVREPYKPLHDFILEYNHLFYQYKKVDFQVDEFTAAMNLLESCNLDASKQEVVMAALDKEITYDTMRQTLLRIYNNEDRNINSSEQVFYGQQSTSKFTTNEPYQPTFYSSAGANNRFINRNVPRSRSLKRRREQSSERPRSSGPSRWSSDRYRASDNTKGGKYPKLKLNPLTKDGQTSTCNICKAITHWAKYCPEKDKIYDRVKDESKEDKATLPSFNMFIGCTNSVNEGTMAQLVEESKGLAILDSGCNKTVCGENWLRAYINALPVGLSSEVKVLPSEQIFTFGDGKTILSKRKIKMPCWIGGRRGTFTTDVVDCNIPLLLSRDSMEIINLVLNFRKNEASFFDENIKVKLKVTASGHLALPISL